jgi:hypothetical protein
VQEAVEDIISRGVGELRKNAFGDDIEDAKTLAWSREQAWIVLKKLSTQEEVPLCRYICICSIDRLRIQIPYHDLLIDFPFKGDETSLRNMEHAELISINTYNGTHLYNMYNFSFLNTEVNFFLQVVRQAYVRASPCINTSSSS